MVPVSILWGFNQCYQQIQNLFKFIRTTIMKLNCGRDSVWLPWVGSALPYFCQMEPGWFLKQIFQAPLVSVRQGVVWLIQGCFTCWEWRLWQRCISVTAIHAGGCLPGIHGYNASDTEPFSIHENHLLEFNAVHWIIVSYIFCIFLKTLVVDWIL